MPEPEPDLFEAPALSIVPNVEAPAALQLLAERYWDLAGVDSETGDPQWTFKTSTLNFAVWSGAAHYAAAAGSTATANDYACARCKGPLTLTSRQVLRDAVRGRDAECRLCKTQVDQQAAKVLTEEGLEKRAAKLREQENALNEQQLRAQLESERRAYIESEYVVGFDSEEYLLDEAPLLARLGILSVVSGTGDQSGIVVGVNLHDDSIAPGAELSRRLFMAAWAADLLQIHPSTPSDALVWEADSAIGTGSIFANKVRFFAGSNGSLPERLSKMVAAARIRASLDGMWSTDRDALQTLARQVVAEEAARYLTSELVAYRLPHLTEKNTEALKLVTELGSSLFSLGHLYGFAWRAAHDASGAYQRHGGMSAENAITFGLRKFQTFIQAAIDDPGSMREPFNEIRAVPLSAVTRLIFNDILRLNPMTATPEHIAETLGSPPDDELVAQCDATIPSRSELMAKLRTSRQQWTPGQFRTVLARLEDWEPDLCAPQCAHERVGAVAAEASRTLSRIVSFTDDETAAIMTAEATGVANAFRDNVRTGDALLTELLRQLVDAPAQTDTYF